MEHETENETGTDAQTDEKFTCEYTVLSCMKNLLSLPVIISITSISSFLKVWLNMTFIEGS